MYIYCNTTSEKTYVRFGKRFKHGKSINYLAMNPRIKDIYSERLAELQYGYISEEEFNEWCEDTLEDYVWEPHISCFECDETTDLPIIRNISQAKTLIGFIQRFENDMPCQAFLVKGEQVGLGTDREPLINVIQEIPIEYDIDDLIDIVVEAMADGFEICKKSDEEYSDEFVHLKGQAFLYKDNIFIYPKSSFIQDWEYKGPVMDKFKYESEASVNYDDLECIYINADNNGGREDVADCINEWSSSIYERPYYFENRYRIAVEIDGDDIYVLGDSDAMWDFTNEYPVDYDEIDVPPKLLQKLKSMKFYG